MRTAQGEWGNSAENGELGIPMFKGVIEDEEVTKETGKSPRKWEENQERIVSGKQLCQGS